jgi:hypothetical protein
LLLQIEKGGVELYVINYVWRDINHTHYIVETLLLHKSSNNNYG